MRRALAWLRDPRHEGRIVALLVALALLVRVGYVLTLEPRLYWYDGEQYSRLASGLVEHGVYDDVRGRPSAFWPPGYPFLMAGVWALFGVNVAALRLVQSAIGAVTVLLVQRFARRAIGLTGSLVAALVTALYPLYVYATGTPFPVTLLAAQMAAAVLLVVVSVERGSARAAAGAGVVLGWASLTSGSALPPALLFAGWMVWHGATGSGGRVRRNARLALVYLVALAAVLGAWTARNQRALGHPVLISLNGGYNLWLGNYPEVAAETGNRMDLPGMSAEADSIWYDMNSEYLQDRAFAMRARQHIREDLPRFVRLSASKALNLWALTTEPLTRDRPRLGIEKLASILSYGVLLPFAWIWLVRSSPRSRTAVLILLLFLVYTAVHALLLSKVRYRLPIDSFVIVYGVGGLMAAARALARLAQRGGGAGIESRPA